VVVAARDRLRLAAVSVDLDSLPHYCRIHGVPASLLDAEARALVATRAVPRLLELFQSVGIVGTFFVIAGDLEDQRLRGALSRAHAQGVELASHSSAHDYAMSRWSAADIAADLRLADEAIGQLVGARPVGFRAPGYTLSVRLLEAVAALGYTYDSSAFPSTPYYAAKAAVMATLGLLGRPSRAVLDSPRVLTAPRTPYRPSLSAPYQRGLAPLVELPISVTPGLGVPFIGTFVTVAPWPIVRGALRSLSGDPLINLELHAVDVLDERDGISPALVRQQRDLRVPVREKLRRLQTLFRRLCVDREVVTLGAAAQRLTPLLSPTP
jgi:hypothetical protein